MKAGEKMQLGKDRLLSTIKGNLWIRAILMNILVFIGTQVFLQPIFESNDDNYMAAIVYGAYGSYETRMLFTNVLLGKAIKLLLLICPVLPWYTIVQYSAVFIASTVITYLIIKNEKNEYRYIFRLDSAYFFWI